VFDLSIPKLLVLTVIALVIFGPNELPKIASQVGRALRDLRRIAEGARNDLREGLGPEFADFEIEDPNPKRFVQKHLSGDLNADPGAQQQPARQAAANDTPLTPGERPPFDPERDMSPEFFNQAIRRQRLGDLQGLPGCGIGADRRPGGRQVACYGGGKTRCSWPRVVMPSLVNTLLR
jgi:sec-independent protein translocase protein TatB